MANMDASYFPMHRHHLQSLRRKLNLGHQFWSRHGYVPYRVQFVKKHKGYNHLARSSSRGGRCFLRGLLLLPLLSNGNPPVCTSHCFATPFDPATSNTEPSRCQQGAISRISLRAVHRPPTTCFMALFRTTSVTDPESQCIFAPCARSASSRRPSRLLPSSCIQCTRRWSCA
ncbi:uncharacterized protein SCHCODRAFT_02101686 [Schizophyllum commune H4-8]|uniref:uncharacterized protein n=1 Tax=Schizophyllum commune (strain H4-8 / FGSC 9210) TaxID=578458 RepID=UPI00215F374D|nr:uncharacterized protein SCHCODRAFT_02101686 [Schizophyllum commune H4-8]KAI5886590.1 hypothetical protein SCHCODRAFT_02101686 [Schizophyllum commune H4-8]